MNPYYRLSYTTYDLEKTFLGNLKGSSLVFQVLKIEKAETLRAFRARLSDGFQMSDSVMFYQNLNKKIKTLQDCTYPCINILEYDILANKYIAIADFKYVRSFDEIVGGPENISEDFFDKLQDGLKCLPSETK